MEQRLCMLGKYFTAELHSLDLHHHHHRFEAGPHYVVHAGLELTLQPSTLELGLLLLQSLE